MKRFGFMDLSDEIKERLIFKQRVENIKRFLEGVELYLDIDSHEMDLMVSREYAIEMIEEDDIDYTEDGDFIADADGFNFDMVLKMPV